MKAVPERIRDAAATRVATTLKTQAPSVRAAVNAGRPLDAEENANRKLQFIQRKVKCDLDLAARIANYEDPNSLPLTPSQKAEAESLQGNTVDFVPARFLVMARAASRSVARVAFSNRTAQGTGFMISPRLFLTNHHVISSVEEANSYVLEFDYEEDANLNKVPVTRFRLDPATLFLFDPTDDLDFAVVAVGKRLDGDHSLEDFGYLPLLNSPDRHIKAIYVNVIQHPEGRPKELVLRENRITGRTENTLIYGADTLKGSSGSPVLNDDWETIALHHWGSPERALLDDTGDELPTEGNEGIRIGSIVKHLQAELENLSGEKASLLREAITPSFRQPSLYRGHFQERNTDVMLPKEEKANKEGTTSFKPGDTATWNIPLVVSVSLGGSASVAAAVEKKEEDSTNEAEAFKFVPDPKYSNRRGYNPNFLGINVSLPKLTAQQRAIAAQNLKAKPGDDPLEVKYQHFSVVMNGNRRLPFFTAVNIDGASVVTINRKKGTVTKVEDPDDDEGAEAYEKWYDDERIEAAKRSDQSLYSSAALKNFQRGHLVKRTDPSWGSVERAFKGQADTFHFTNCAPQHKGFNPIRTRWAGVEDWISKGSDDEDLRVTVFCGPVLRADDPKRDYIRVPREFWKVIARVENGKLLATAILADQSDLLAGEESAGAEDLPPFPDKLPQDYQVTVAELEELTGLNFGSLREHDTFAGGPEAISGHPRRRIETLSDIQIHRRRD